MATKRIIDLQEASVSEDMWVMTDNATTGTKRFNAKTLFDATADAQAATTAAQTAAGQAQGATTAANDAASAANDAADNADAKAALADTAATNADTATQAANTATTNATNAAQAANNAADVAIEAAEDMPKLVGTVDTAQTVADAWETTMEGATVYGKSVQDGTPTPDNPVEVQVVGGRNLNQTVSMTTEAGGGFTSNTPYRLGSVVEGRTYTLSMDVLVASTGNLGLYPGTGTTSLAGISVASVGRHSVTFTANASGEIRPYKGAGAWSGNTEVIDNIQLEAGTTATPYVPYGCIGLQTGETVTPIDLQGNTLASLPDGTRDVLRVDSAGRAWIEQNIRHVILGDYTLNYDSSGYFWRNSPDIVPKRTNSRTDNMLATSYQQSTYNGVNTQDGTIGWNNGYLKVHDNRYTTGAALQAATANEHVYLPLATPQTIELGTITPPDIAPGDTLAIYASLDPEWAIEYTQDPNLVISTLQSSIAPVEGSTASANYSVGSYLIHANQLYRVTSAIATGEAIAPGTNCTACTVMGELVRLTA